MNFKHLLQRLHSSKNTNSRVYLDYAAATPVSKEVMDVMLPYFSDVSGNPSAIHQEGVKARNAIETERARLAKCLRIRAEDCLFTGSGTEANNLALYGLVRSLHEIEGVPFVDIEIISTKIEHPSIVEVLKHLEEIGVTVLYCDVNDEGRIDEKHLKSLLTLKTTLVTFAYVNSEIGVIQDVKKISRIVRKWNTESGSNIKVHLDASQAPLWLPCQMDMLGVDLMTLDGGKCYGPKGVGVLAYRHDVKMKGVTLGGDQERGLRAGTENTALIVGCVEAIARGQDTWEEKSLTVSKLRDFMITALEKEINGVIVNGGREDRVANNVNISIPGIESEYAVITLDTNGIAASTKSACSGASGGGSKVVFEISDDQDRADSTIRFSLGFSTTEKELQAAILILKEHVERMRTFQTTQM